MKKIILFTVMTAIFATVTVFSQTTGKLVSSKTWITFFSSTPAEDIKAGNSASVSTINKETGEVVFSVPMQGFEFEKALMQKHFNSDKFLDTQKYPKAKLTGKITNLGQIDFSKDGTYAADVEGDLTIRDVTNPIKEKGTIAVKGGVYEVNSKFNVTLADYKVTFSEGKPSTNIAKTVEVTVQAEYRNE